MKERPYTEALSMLAALQKKLGRRPPRAKISAMVEKIIVESGLSKDNRRESFRLLATCALKNLEPMYRNW